MLGKAPPPPAGIELAALVRDLLPRAQARADRRTPVAQLADLPLSELAIELLSFIEIERDTRSEWLPVAAEIQRKIKSLFDALDATPPLEEVIAQELDGINSFFPTAGLKARGVAGLYASVIDLIMDPVLDQVALLESKGQRL